MKYIKRYKKVDGYLTEFRRVFKDKVKTKEDKRE